MEWRKVNIPGYEELYEVSEYGHVKGLNYRNMGIAQIVKPKVDSNGYHHIRLHKDKTQKQISVQRLVALSFVANTDLVNNVEVNHIDGVKAHNHYTNLEWVSRSRNRKHAFELGLRRRLYGEANPNYRHGRYVGTCND